MKKTLLALGILVLTALPAFGNIPPVITNFQGVLRDAQNNPLNGSYAMTFTYWNDPAAAADANHIGWEDHPAVTVTGGLFSALLGSQPFNAGRSGYGGGSIATLFGDFDQVWLEVKVGAEVLSPRMRFAAAPYAFNCSQVQDRGPGEFLLNFQSNAFHTGTLGLDAGTTLDVNGTATLNGELRMDDDGPDGAQAIWFFDAGSATDERIGWSDAQDRFEATDNLSVGAAIRVSSDAGLADAVAYSKFGLNAQVPDSGAMLDTSDVYVGDDVELDGALFLNASVYMDDDGPDGVQSIYFWDDGVRSNESLLWSEAQDRFEFSNDLATAGVVRTGTSAVAPVAYNAIGAGAAENALVASASDLYVTDALEVDGELLLHRFIQMNPDGPDGGQEIDFYEGGISTGRWLRWDDAANRFHFNDALKLDGAIELNTTIEMDDDGPDGNQRIYFWEAGILNGESFGWTDPNDRFEMTDSLHVVGDLSATGAKPFVQNHPQRPDLSIVYAALEGNEVGTYTRGTARLEGGEARVPLDGTFALVTNPEVGLTAHLTPRGRGAALYVEALSTTELVVRAEEGSSRDAAFDFVVFGLRIGFEEHAVVQPRLGEAPIPSQAAVEARFSGHPELRAHTALARFADMQTRALGAPPADRSRSQALREAIGLYDPEGDGASPLVLAQDSSQGDPPAPPRTADSGREDLAQRRAPIEAAPGDVIGARSFRAVLPDLAGLLPVEGPVEAGDVVVNDPAVPGRARRGDRAADGGVLGIVTDTAGVALGAGGDDGTRAAIAMTGVVLCKVDATYGAILPNDLLTTSSTPGHAMRAVDPAAGTVLGKALEGLAEGTGTIRVLVTLR